MPALYDLTEFLKLSSVLNYNLSAASINRYNVLRLITASKRLHLDESKDRADKIIVMEALNFIFDAYDQKRRRLGPLAVLHPLRATALLARSLETVTVADLLTALFHDVLEDINPVDFAFHEWQKIEQRIDRILDQIDSETAEWGLMNRLVCLTRTQHEAYYQYIGRILDHSGDSFQLIQTKLADRLDNTLDMRIDLQDPLEGIDFFENLFQLLFVNTYPGYDPGISHPPVSPLNGARRLYQLFKNAVLLTLIRQAVDLSSDPTSQKLFSALCHASLKEAQRTLIHLIGFHYKGTAEQRTLILGAMDYCFSGGADIVTSPQTNQQLDGLFATYFGLPSDDLRNQRLDMLYQNKPLMIQASIAFIVIFLNFVNDPDYYVKGITAAGIEPHIRT